MASYQDTHECSQRTLLKQCLSENDGSRHFNYVVLLRKCFFGEQLLDFGLNSHLLLARSLKLHLLALLLRVPSNAMRCAHFDAHQHCVLVLITWALHGAVHP